MLDRRTFLASTAATLAATALPGGALQPAVFISRGASDVLLLPGFDTISVLLEEWDRRVLEDFQLAVYRSMPELLE